MTVEKLIEELKKFPSDYEVVFFDGESLFCAIPSNNQQNQENENA